MLLRRASFAVLLVPLVYLGVAALLHDGLKAQPNLVLAWSVDDFAAELGAAGGADAIRSGIALDMLFIVVFAGLALVLLRRAGHAWWWLPLAYAFLDTAENALAWYLVGTDPEAGTVKALAAIGVLKFVFFFATLGALFSACRRVDPAP